MLIPEAFYINLNTLRRAASNGDLALVSCELPFDGGACGTVCAVEHEGGEYTMIPFGHITVGINKGSEVLRQAAKDAFGKMLALLREESTVFAAERQGDLMLLHRYNATTKKWVPCNFAMPVADPFDYYAPPDDAEKAVAGALADAVIAMTDEEAEEAEGSAHIVH